MRPVIISGPLPGSSAGSIGGVAIHTESIAGEFARTGRESLVLDDSHVYGRAPEPAIGVRGASLAQTARIAARHPALAAGIATRVMRSSERGRLGIPLPTALVRPLLVASGARRFPNAVLHVQQADYRPLYADWAGLSAPRVLVVHGLGLLDTSPVPGLTQIVRDNISTATALVTPSRALAEEVGALRGSSDRVTVIPNAVDHAVFRPHSRDACRAELDLDPAVPLIVYVGRITEHKGVRELIDAWQLLRSWHPDARLALVGPRTEPIVPPSPGILTPGAVGADRAALWFGASDVVAVPSRYEGFGLTALEAMACARPVVATRVGGLAEVVPEDVGVLVPPRDSEALAAGVRSLLDDPDLARRRAAEGARIAAGYSWESTARAFGALYDSL